MSDSTLLSAKSRVGSKSETLNSVSKHQSQMISEHTEDMERYLAFVDDLENKIIFPGNQGIPKKIKNKKIPTSSGSTSVKVSCPISICNKESLENKIPCLEVYRNS